jgi:hypothetical protein
MRRRPRRGERTADRFRPRLDRGAALSKQLKRSRVNRRVLFVLVGVTGEENFDSRVRETFVDVAGRLTAIPVQRKKRLAVLRWLVEDFQPSRLYSEAEVNRIISRRHPDFAALRRYLVDEELMQRDHGVYWRTGSMPNVGWDPPSWPAE